MYSSFVIKPHQRCDGYMLTLSVVDRVFEPRSDQTKDNKIGNCCVSAKNTELKSKRKDGLAQNPYNVSQ